MEINSMFVTKDINDDEHSKMVILEQKYLTLAHEIQSLCGLGKNTTQSLIHLQNSLMWAKNSIEKWEEK